MKVSSFVKIYGFMLILIIWGFYLTELIVEIPKQIAMAILLSMGIVPLIYEIWWLIKDAEE